MLGFPSRTSKQQTAKPKAKGNGERRAASSQQQAAEAAAAAAGPGTGCQLGNACVSRIVRSVRSSAVPSLSACLAWPGWLAKAMTDWDDFSHVLGPRHDCRAYSPALPISLHWLELPFNADIIHGPTDEGLSLDADHHGAPTQWVSYYTLPPSSSADTACATMSMGPKRVGLASTCTDQASTAARSDHARAPEAGKAPFEDGCAVHRLT